MLQCKIKKGKNYNEESRMDAPGFSGLLALMVDICLAQDVKGSRDHPLFSRMPGYTIQRYEEKTFEAHPFQSSGAGSLFGGGPGLTGLQATIPVNNPYLPTALRTAALAANLVATIEKEEGSEVFHRRFGTRRACGGMSYYQGGIFWELVGLPCSDSNTEARRTRRLTENFSIGGFLCEPPCSLYLCV